MKACLCINRSAYYYYGAFLFFDLNILILDSINKELLVVCLSYMYSLLLVFYGTQICMKVAVLVIAA